MKTILTVLILALLTSCNMKRYCNEKFPPQEKVKDSINFVEKIVYRDTTIYRLLPGEIRIDTLYIDTTDNSAKSELETSLARSSAFYKDGRLIHELRQKDSVLSFLIQNAIKEHSTVDYRDREVIKVEIRNELTGWQHSQIYAAWILAIILLVSALWRKLPSALVSKVMQVFKKKKPP